MRPRPLALLLVLAASAAGICGTARAQHEHALSHPPERSPSALDLELARNASGTAWQPEDTPHAALHTREGAWELMLHELLFAGHDFQGTDRGASAPVAMGWFMGMARRRFESGTLTARLMLSPEPGTVRSGGYPLLLQTGETYKGEALRDRQHPHDLFMEVGLIYTQALSDGLALQVYAAPSGEPALGPVAYPHRQSAMSDPLAALSHHWQDSTHISFGVLTFGVITRRVKLEGCWFNGREPDETRYDFDLRRPDSYSVRLSIAPTASVAGQVSYGYLAGPETLRPSEAVHRVTASLMYGTTIGSAGQWASTAVYGMNKEEHDAPTNAILLETNLDLDGRNVVFGRGEVVQKVGHDLVLAPALDESRFVVGALAAGYLRNFCPLAGFLPGVGVRGAINVVPAALKPFYGTRVPLGGIVFLRLAIAPRMPAGEHGGSHEP